MEISLTQKQRKIVAIARAKGKITLMEARMIYSDKRALVNALERLCMANFLKRGERADNFIYNRENDQTITSYLSN